MTNCPICKTETSHFFRKEFLEYNKCPECGLIFSPTVLTWSGKDFRDKIYNDQYIDHDPEFVHKRPYENAMEFLPELKGKRHLDYGGGNGAMSHILKENGIDSYTWDLFYKKDVIIAEYMDAITCFEVIEHSVYPNEMFNDFRGILCKGGELIIKTSMYDDWGITTREQFRDHWYVMPINGHVSFYCQKTFEVLAGMFGFECTQKGCVVNRFIKK
jgi:2-polyprenyl-6-hydroxyphenyl methylase/3-demethylubiquinone-9 3-methyltransferase